MTATGHAVLGTVIAVSIHNPVVAIPVAILSHIAADAFPHWDTGTNRKTKSHSAFFSQSIVDLALSFILPFLLVTFLFPGTSLAYLYLIVISAQLLDWLSAPYIFLKWHFPPFTWPYHFQISFDNRLNKPWGIILQIAVLVALIIFAKIIY